MMEKLKAFQEGLYILHGVIVDNSDLFRQKLGDTSKIAKSAKSLYEAFSNGYIKKYGGIRGSRKLFSDLISYKIPDFNYQQIVNWSLGPNYKWITTVI
jgi:hypothetical protein